MMHPRTYRDQSTWRRRDRRSSKLDASKEMVQICRIQRTVREGTAAEGEGEGVSVDSHVTMRNKASKVNRVEAGFSSTSSVDHLQGNNSSKQRARLQLRLSDFELQVSCNLLILRLFRVSNGAEGVFWSAGAPRGIETV